MTHPHPPRTPFDKEADTFLGLLLGGLAACVGNPGDGFYFTLADGGWVKDQPFRLIRHKANPSKRRPSLGKQTK